MADDTERQDEPAAPDISGPPSLRDALAAFTEYRPEPWRDYPGFIASLLDAGYERNPCPVHCPDHGKREHDHLRNEDGDLIVWADGTWSNWDLTQPARRVYPAYPVPKRYTVLNAVEDSIRSLIGPRRSPFFGGPVPKVDLPKACYKTASGLQVHIRGACQCKR